MARRETQTASPSKPLSSEELRLIDCWWRACNYLSVGMIYLRDNPLLKEPLQPEHVKHRLLGHWGASPALSFVWAHLNRVIKRDDLDVLFMAGPGHGAPGVLGPAYLEGTYSEIYPDKSEDIEGMQKFFKQFSFPGHIGSHVTPETPGSIHEGGELGYSLSHAYGAALDNPDLIVACVVGDGEAETGPLATAWHSNKFINPVRDGAVLPILNLNGYKIANPTILARISHEELEALFTGYGYKPHFVEGSDPSEMHQLMAATLDEITGLSRVNRLSNSRSLEPCGCSVAGISLNRSTTLTKRTFRSGRCSRRMAVAASDSAVGTSPQQAMTTSGSEPWSLLAKRQMPMPLAQWTTASSMVANCR